MAEKKTKLAEIKTKPTTASVQDFINAIKDEQKRKDSFVLLEMMKKATGEEPVLWMINHHYLMRFVGPPRLGLIWINFVHLFLVSLLPFATAWVARTRPNFRPTRFCRSRIGG